MLGLLLEVAGHDDGLELPRLEDDKGPTVLTLRHNVLKIFDLGVLEHLVKLGREREGDSALGNAFVVGCGYRFDGSSKKIQNRPGFNIVT